MALDVVAIAGRRRDWRKIYFYWNHFVKWEGQAIADPGERQRRQRQTFVWF